MISEDRANEGKRVPRATYRLQLGPNLTLDDASQLIGYLERLGVSHVYLSPCLQAAPGSSHGYDVVDPTRVNEELGGESAFESLVEAVRERGMGVVLDVVPNHMAIGSRRNGWWWDVLRNGPCSVFAEYFDVDWDHPEERLKQKVLLPVLGDHYGRVLEAGKLSVAQEASQLLLRYHEHRFAIAPESVAELLQRAADVAGSRELGELARGFAELPRPEIDDHEGKRDRVERLRGLDAILAELLDREGEALAAVERELETLNGDADALDGFLEAQSYRLAYWRTARWDLGYRRFFDIDTLVGLRIEDPQVFADTHQRILEWVRRGDVDGLRIDHPDGLKDPEDYVRRLRAADEGLWIVVEKILHAGEGLPRSWPVDGTTGYDFLRSAGGLFVDGRHERAMSEIYARFTGHGEDWETVAHDSKQLVLEELLGSDVNRLAELGLTLCERHRRYRDYTRDEIHSALRELIAGFPVYRTYVRAGHEPTAEDVARLDEAVAAARAQRPDLDERLLRFLRNVVLLILDGEPERDFSQRFQQLTGPATAKGVEDTAFYRYVRMIALNEVGGDPALFGVSPERFHAEMELASRDWPGSMLASSTHDTKRSEDVRARLAVLSEIPGAWEATVQRWAEHANVHRRGPVPDRRDEYMIYQTLVGAWPIDAERAVAYVMKALREAKVHTSWTRQQVVYEEATQAFVEALLDDVWMQEQIQALVDWIAPFGRINGLAQALLKLAGPGVPDVYQGMELWTLTLVDPDNRQPVDYGLRERLLDELEGMTAEQVIGRDEEGLTKLWVTWKALQLRKRRFDALGPPGDYRALRPEGERSRHVVAFVRGGDVLVAVPRLSLELRGGGWSDTTIPLPAGSWRNLLGGGGGDARAATLDGGRDVPAEQLFAPFPVALMERVS
jgi:(1->4)-alpha-D-glucan 1-alpha-D-glucosylmutase